MEKFIIVFALMGVISLGCESDAPSEYSVIHINSNTSLSEDWAKLRNAQKINFLTISGVDVRNLEILKSVEQIGNLSIRDCPKIESLEGLGDMKIEKLTIIDCSSLQSLDGLEMVELTGEIHVINCPTLEEMPILNRVTRLRALNFTHCDDLNVIDGFKYLSEVRGNITFALSEDIKEVEMPALKEINGSLMFDECKSIRTLSFPELRNIEDVLSIENGNGVTDLSGFGQLERVRELLIMDNNSLTSIESLSGLEFVKNIRIEGNPIADFCPMKNVIRNNDVTYWIKAPSTNHDYIRGEYFESCD